MCLYVNVFTYIYIHIYIYVHIYIYIERERVQCPALLDCLVSFACFDCEWSEEFAKYVYINIYIYRERERETYLHMYDYNHGEALLQHCSSTPICSSSM